MSFLVLLFIAMPLKYGAGKPLAVKIVGSGHGALFVLYVAAALYAALWHRWPFPKLLKILAASLYPFGTFLIDRPLREEAAAREGSRSGPAPEFTPTSSSGEAVRAETATSTKAPTRPE